MNISLAVDRKSYRDCAVLVMSCDAYSDLWTPFFILLRRYWSDLPFPVYLGAGELSCSAPGVNTLHSSAGKDWTQCLIDYLDQVPHSHVLMTLDDFFLRKSVSTARVAQCLDFAHEKKAIHVRLAPRPKPTHKVRGNEWIGECEAGSPYRLCMQAAIWEKQGLRALLVRGESIWQFEHNGNKRAESLTGGFYSVWHPVLPYEGFFAHHVVEKGRWFPHEKWVLRLKRIPCDFSRRGTLSWAQTTLYQCAQILDHSLDIFPWKQKKQLKTWIKRLLQPFFSTQFKRMHAG